MPEFDEIKKPAHYNQGKIQVWDFIVDQQMGYLDGCAVKYICRHKHKGTAIKDLEKAMAYLGRLIEELKKAEVSTPDREVQEICPHIFATATDIKDMAQCDNCGKIVSATIPAGVRQRPIDWPAAEATHRLVTAAEQAKTRIADRIAACLHLHATDWGTCADCGSTLLKPTSGVTNS